MVRAPYRLIGLAIAVACAGAFFTSPGPASAAQKKQYAQNGEKPLRGVVRYRRQGGYSYKATDTMGSTGGYWRFIDPDSQRQSPSGPFDNGFFFDSGVGPRGGQSPYQN